MPSASAFVNENALVNDESAGRITDAAMTTDKTETAIHFVILTAFLINKTPPLKNLV